MAGEENEMGLLHRLSDLFSMGTVTVSQTDLLTGCPASRGSSRAASLTWLPEVSVPTAVDGHCQEDIEKTFQFLIHRLGGGEAVLMVGDIYGGGCQRERGLLCWEVAQELFQETQRSHMELSEAATPKEEGEGAQTPGVSACPVGSRSITAKLILFVFREEWLKQQEGKGTVREILKDVRQRCQLFVPTVLGLICCQSDGSELSDCLILLAHSISEVFDIPPTRAPACVNAYIKSRPSSILNTKRLICELLTSSDTAYRPSSQGRMGVKGLTCFPWYSRRKERAKLPKTPSLEGTASRAETLRTAKGSSDGQRHCTYYSEKARLSFRHELGSAISVIDSTN